MTAPRIGATLDGRYQIVDRLAARVRSIAASASRIETTTCAAWAGRRRRGDLSLSMVSCMAEDLAVEEDIDLEAGAISIPAKGADNTLDVDPPPPPHAARLRPRRVQGLSQSQPQRYADRAA